MSLHDTYTLNSPNGAFSATFMRRGATIMSLTLNGKPLVTGHDSPEEFYADHHYFGTTVGRVANRIAKGTLTLPSGTFHTPINENSNTLHGGTEGFDRKFFSEPVKNEEENSLTFSLLSSDGDQGFPGDVEVTVKYTVEDSEEGNGGSLSIEYSARLTDETPETAISLTNHAFFNITNNENISGTQLRLISNKSLAVDDQLIPTGTISPLEVVSTFSDSDPTILGSDEPFIDNCFVVSEMEPNSVPIDTRSLPLAKVAEAFAPDSKIRLTVLTTEPSMQVYTGDGVNVPGKYGKRAGVCFEASRFIDAANKPEWRNMALLTNGSVYGALTRYEFSQL